MSTKGHCGPAPAPLGRSVVVGAGQQAPPAWDECPRIVVDEAVLASPSATVTALHEAWAARQPVVIELAVDAGRFRTPSSVTGAPWDAGVDVECSDDRLHFLVWANTWDARGEAPVWWWAVKAARLAEGAALTHDGPADLALAGGRDLWVDGGPREPWAREDLGGCGLVHREAVEAGQLAVDPEPVVPTADLALDQRDAVAHQRGPARVIAPAGSGKTRVLTERLRHLVVDRQWDAASILAVAYNVKARDEMVERTAGLGARVQTLNGLAYSIVTEHRGSRPTVIDEREVRGLLDRLTPPRARRANTDPLAPYIEALTEVRLALRPPGQVESDRGDVPGLAELVAPYREELARRGCVDFDEQVACAVEALLVDGDLRRRVQARHRHLLVDEFQDLTPAHVVLLRLVAGPSLDVFGVGDDDQVIYGHAGADPRFLIDFSRWFPGGGEHALEVNHRSAAPIVTTAATLLDYNHRRVRKVIRARPDAATGPEAVRIETHQPEVGAATLVQIVSHWLDQGCRPNDIAVLTRVHALLLAPHVALAEAGIPVHSTVGAELLTRTGARAALAYLRIAAGDAIAPADLTEIYRRPSRGLPQWITKWFRRPMSVPELRALSDRIDDFKVGEKIEALADDLALVAKAGGGTTRQALEVVRDAIGLGEAMAGLDRSKGGEGSSQLDDIEALLQVADLHPRIEGFDTWLRRALGPTNSAGPAVTLSTVHRVKGREWPRVLVAGVTAGLLPHRLAADEEEERRVLHVAITRVRDRVVVLGDSTRPSPFLGELTGVAPKRPERPGPPRFERADTRAAASSERRPGGRPAAGPPLTGTAAVLEEKLKAWRLERSRADGVPAYVVASDATVREIARTAPSSLAELSRVKGIGPAKLQRYGEDILALVASAPSTDSANPEMA